MKHKDCINCITKKTFSRCIVDDPFNYKFKEEKYFVKMPVLPQMIDGCLIWIIDLFKEKDGTGKTFYFANYFKTVGYEPIFNVSIDERTETFLMRNRHGIFNVSVSDSIPHVISKPSKPKIKVAHSIEETMNLVKDV